MTLYEQIDRECERYQGRQWTIGKLLSGVRGQDEWDEILNRCQLGVALSTAQTWARTYRHWRDTFQKWEERPYRLSWTCYEATATLSRHERLRILKDAWEEYRDEHNGMASDWVQEEAKRVRGTSGR